MRIPESIAFGFVIVPVTGYAGLIRVNIITPTRLHLMYAGKAFCPPESLLQDIYNEFTEWFDDIDDWRHVKCQKK